MGYSAKGGGIICFKEGTFEIIISDAKRKLREISWSVYAAKEYPLCIQVCPGKQYIREDLYAVLEEFLPHMESMQLSFAGSDAATWKIELKGGQIAESYIDDSPKEICRSLLTMS